MLKRDMLLRFSAPLAWLPIRVGLNDGRWIPNHPEEHFLPILKTELCMNAITKSASRRRYSQGCTCCRHGGCDFQMPPRVPSFSEPSGPYHFPLLPPPIDGKYQTASSLQTPSMCAAYCSGVEGATVFGVQNGDNCFCGKSYGKHGISTACNSPCNGDPDSICGGIRVNSVYSLTVPLDRYACDSLGVKGLGVYPFCVRPGYPTGYTYNRD